MEANGRLQCSNNKCLWPECLVEAARGILSRVLSVLGVLRLANGRLERPNNRGYGGKRQAASALHDRGLWRQTGSCNTRTINACGQSAWWKLSRGIVSILRVLSVLGVLRLANGRLERPNNRELWRQTAGCNALTTEGYGGKREAATLEQQMLVARVLGGSCREDFKHFKGFKRFSGFKAGKRQAWMP